LIPGLVSLVLLPTLLVAGIFSASELDAHRKWMDDAQEHKDDIREAIEAKDLAKLRTAAQSIAALTAKEQAFWARTALKQAQEIAIKNRAEARDLVRAAQASKLGDAQAAFASLERTCSSCHDLHFEKHPSIAPAAKP